MRRVSDWSDALAPTRVNVGCGSAPTPGWINLDNSPSLLIPDWAIEHLRRLRVISPPQAAVARMRTRSGVRRASALRLPFGPESVDAIYSSHMLEHLSRSEAKRFLLEAKRVLRPGGRLRIVVPDLRRFVESYVTHGDADSFLADLRMAQDERGLKEIVGGFRGHRWMYDAQSLERTLSSIGFEEVCRVSPGETGLPDPGALDLREREEESIYLEAVRR